MALKVLGVGSSMREGSYGTRALKIVLDRMEKLQAETHFMGQSTVVLDGERANGETYWIAHHVSESEGKRTLFIAYSLL
jgi:SnoaL-like domain